MMVAHQYQLNESFKALLNGIFSDKEVTTKLKIAFEEVVNDRATTQKVNLEKLKDEALEQIRNELLTKDVFQSEIKAIEAKLEAEIAKVRQELAETKQELKVEIAEAKQELKAEIAKVKQELEAKVAKVESNVCSIRQEMKFYAIGLGALIILFQPKVFDFITSFFK